MLGETSGRVAWQGHTTLPGAICRHHVSSQRCGFAEDLHSVEFPFTWKFIKQGRTAARLYLAFKETLNKSSFPRRRESRVLILLGFAFGKHDFSE
jgi:hypothetical protein